MNHVTKNFVKVGLFPLLVYLANDIICRFWFNWYVTYGVDSYFHFLGGLSIAVSSFNAFSILEKENIFTSKNNLVITFAIVATVAFAATIWEIYEFFWDIFFKTNLQPSMNDTVKDLVLGILGGIFFSFFAFSRTKSADRSRKWYTLSNMFRTADPAYDPLKTDAETRMRD